MKRSLNKTQVMRDVFSATLAGSSLESLLADRGRSFRASVLNQFLAQAPGSESVAPVLYNVVRKENLASGDLSPNVIGHRVREASLDLSKPWAVLQDGSIVNTYDNRVKARAARIDGQVVKKTAEVA